MKVIFPPLPASSVIFKYTNKEAQLLLGDVRREGIQRIAEMDVEMTT